MHREAGGPGREGRTPTKTMSLGEGTKHGECLGVRKFFVWWWFKDFFF